MPSWASSSDSMAMASLAASNDGPVHLTGQAARTFQRIRSAPVSSSRMMEMARRSTFPDTAFCCQSHSAWSVVRPRLRVMLDQVTRPGILRLLSVASVPSR